MHTPPFMHKVKELNQAIWSLDFSKVERMLAHPEVPVNLNLFNISLPLGVMFQMNNSRIARLFLNCPRIDWLAPQSKRSFLSLEQDFGLKFVPKLVGSETGNDRRFYSFCRLSNAFETACPEEAKLIYPKIIESFIEFYGIENFVPFMFDYNVSFMALKIALNYCTLSDCLKKTGRTPLHTAFRLDAAKFFIEAGADVNALDSHGYSPLMKAVERGDVDIASLLIENGASKEYINSSFISVICPKNYKIIFETFQISETLFRDFLAIKEQISYKNLLLLFKEYPNFKEIFFSDLPGNLPIIYEKTEKLDEIKEFRMYEWTDEDFLRFLKILATKTYDLSRHRIVRDRLKRHSNDLLAISIKSGPGETFRSLIRDYGADPNCIVDGKTPLFVVKPKLIKFLLEHGADPSFESDGFLFYERDDFFKIDTDTDESVWNSMIEVLYRKGFDLCSRTRKTGKSFMDYLLPFSTIELFNDHYSIQMPIKLINNAFLKAHYSNEPDFLAVLDDEGNSLAHYLLSVPEVVIFGTILKSKILEVKNKAGKSVLDVAVENSVVSAIVRNIDDFQLLKLFVEKCIAYHGPEFISKHGCSILKERLDCRRIKLSELKYFVEDLKVPLEAILQDGYSSLDDCLFSKCNDRGIWDFLIDTGCKPSNDALHRLIVNDETGIVDRLLEYCEDPNELLYSLNEDTYFFTNDAFEAFVLHPRIRQAQPENCLNDCTTLDQYFFAFSNSYEHIADMLFQAGIDARRLIGSGVFCVCPDFNENSYDDCVVDFLLRNGWTLKDFDNIFISEGYSLRQCFIDEGSTSLLQSRPLGETILLSKFSDLNLDDVTGSKNECAICREEFVDAESVLLLSCKHVFHPECLSGYSRRNPDCPYCRSPLSSPLPK